MRRWCELWCGLALAGCSPADFDGAPYPHDFWDCPGDVDRDVDPVPSPEAMASLQGFGSHWSGTLSLAVEGSTEMFDVPADIRYDFSRAYHVESSIPLSGNCTGSVAGLLVPTVVQVLDWVGETQEEFLVATAERTGWHGGTWEWDGNVAGGGATAGRDGRGEAEVALFEALFGAEAPAELADVVVSIARRQGEAAYVAFDIGELRVPSRVDGAGYLSRVPEE